METLMESTSRDSAMWGVRTGGRLEEGRTIAPGQEALWDAKLKGPGKNGVSTERSDTNK